MVVIIVINIITIILVIITITGPAKWISKWGGHGTLKSIVGHHG